MKCPECGAGVNEKSIACENCGFPFQKRTQASTQNSVFTNDISYMKCSECGANVNVIIPARIEPPVRSLRATIPDFQSHQIILDLPSYFAVRQMPVKAAIAPLKRLRP